MSDAVISVIIGALVTLGLKAIDVWNQRNPPEKPQRRRRGR